jgi:hypothetical protein
MLSSLRVTSVAVARTDSLLSSLLYLSLVEEDVYELWLFAMIALR